MLGYWFIILIHFGGSGNDTQEIKPTDTWVSVERCNGSNSP